MNREGKKCFLYSQDSNVNNLFFLLAKPEPSPIK